MSTDPGTPPGGSSSGPGGSAGEPDEQELRAAYEAELNRITPAEMMLQAAVSLLNIGARRLGLTGGPAEPAAEGERGAVETGAGESAGRRDLGQVREAIDGVRALLGVLENSVPEQLRPLRDALSQLQLAYARAAQAGDRERAAEAPAQPRQGEEAPQGEDHPRTPGPAQASGRLWVPGS